MIPQLRQPIRPPTFLFIACVLTFSITGCETVPLKRTPSQPQKEALSHLVAQAIDLQHWSIQGKMGIRTEETAHSIQLWWNQQGEDFQLQLTGPFGAGSATIEGNQAFLTLKTGKDTFLETTPEALFQRLFGWQVPISHVFWWVKGSPVPDIPAAQVTWDEQNQLASLSQAHWKVQFSKYQPVNSPQPNKEPSLGPQPSKELPHKITIEKEDKKLTILIHAWQILE
jgi:outer membrane lipoprotein LolB